MEVFHEISKGYSSLTGSFAKDPAVVLRLHRDPESLLLACYGFLDSGFLGGWLEYKFNESRICRNRQYCVAARTTV